MTDRPQESAVELPNRRKFLSLAAATGAALALDSQALSISRGELSAAPPPDPPKTLHVRPRYHRWHVDPGVEWIETNTGYAQLDWTIPFNQAALVLVDVWDRHYLKDTEARGEAVVDDKLLP